MARVHESTIINAPIDAVWHILRNFNSHVDWHPAIATSQIENGQPGDTVGAIRNFTLADGGLLREQLIKLDDEAHELAYCLLEAPLPLNGYVATIKLKPVTETGQTFWTWESTFSPPDHRKQELVTLVAKDIYQAGFRALEDYLGGSGPIHASVHNQTEQGASPSPSYQQIRRHDTSSAGPSAAGTLTTQAIEMDAHGGPEVLRPRQVEVPAPGPGQVRIRQSFIGVNYIDVYCRTGYFNLIDPPGIPGMEAAGTVESIGEGVTHVQPGDAVAYACAPVGAYTGLRTMEAELVIRLPRWLDPQTAAASLLKGVSAGFLLHDVYALQRDDVAVVHAAAGGVGSMLVQWATSLGARVVATVSTPQKAAIAEAHGAYATVIGRGADFVETVMQVSNGRGADVVYDAIGRDTFAQSFEALAIRGHLVSFGQASGPIGEWDIGHYATKSATLSRPNYAHFTQTGEMMEQQATRFFKAVEERMLTLAEPTLYDLGQAAEAHRDLEARRTTGSIVLKV